MCHAAKGFEKGQRRLWHEISGCGGALLVGRHGDVLFGHVVRVGQRAQTVAVGKADEGVREGEEVPRSIGEVGGEVILADHDDGVVFRSSSGRVTVHPRRGIRQPSGRKAPMPVETGVIRDASPDTMNVS